MKIIASKPVWYMICVILLLYATTADFVATTVVIADGQDCNHPWVRIEHKCVTSSARTNSHNGDGALTTIAAAVLPTALDAPHAETALHRPASPSAFVQAADRDDPVPLRC
jgi:hypothetical protein